jgi:hypothetical protein
MTIFKWFTYSKYVMYTYYKISVNTSSSLEDEHLMTESCPGYNYFDMWIGNE